VEISALGRIYFLGSMIGHWDAPTGFSFPDHEAVNMGISPMVPAHKIREILMQPELIEMVKKVNEQMAVEKHRNAVYDIASDKIETTFTRKNFEHALRKASRRVPPSKSGKGKKQA
jgi:hypothetical protein